VYVTVDTGGHMASPAQVYFDQRPLDQHNPPHPEFSTVILTQPDVAEGGGGGKLDALAIAASALTPMTSAASDSAEPLLITSRQQQQFQCGECLGRFWSSQEFFDHWLRLHCRPLGQVATDDDEDDPAALGPHGIPQIRHCERCNHVFVYGMQRFREHSLTCGGASGRMEQPDHRLEPVNRIQEPSVILSGLPIATVTGTIQHGGVKRHADEGGQKQRVGKGRSVPAPTTNPGHGALVSCGVCGAAMRTITAFFLHWLDTHSHLIEILEEVWQCGQCSAPCPLFPTRVGLENHVEREHPFEGKTAFDCAKCASARYASQSQLHDHQRLHSAVRCPRCGVDDDDGSCVEDVAHHYKGKHEVNCMLCKCQIPVEDEESHLSQKHRFEMVWSRTRSLEKIVFVNQPSKDYVEDSSTKGRPRGGVNNSAAKRAKTETPATPSSKLDDAELTSGSVSSAAVVAGNKTESGVGWRCRACAAFFTSEKLLEKHYFANHEFKCKFCEQTMDKDEYGDHLRLHLADERKKAVTGGK